MNSSHDYTHIHMHLNIHSMFASIRIMSLVSNHNRDYYRFMMLFGY